MGIVVITPPAAEPVSLGDAKDHLRVDSADDDSLIEGMIAAARRRTEAFLWRSLVTQTLEWTVDRFPHAATPIRLPQSPVQSITSISYTDDQGNAATLAVADYQTDLVNDPPRIVPAIDSFWPSTQAGKINALVIRFVAGYGDPPAVEEDIKLAMKLMVAHWYAHREELIAGAAFPKIVERSVDTLLVPYRLRGF